MIKCLSDVSFQLLQGQRMAIVGPNGIGKSTFDQDFGERTACDIR